MIILQAMCLLGCHDCCEGLHWGCALVAWKLLQAYSSNRCQSHAKVQEEVPYLGAGSLFSQSTNRCVVQQIRIAIVEHFTDRKTCVNCQHIQRAISCRLLCRLSSGHIWAYLGRWAGTNPSLLPRGKSSLCCMISCWQLCCNY